MEPGGSAWMSNEIHDGDIFVSVKINKERISGSESNAYEIQEKLNKTKEDKIFLTIKKQNGLIKTIKLIRKKIGSTDNMVKRAIWYQTPD